MIGGGFAGIQAVRVLGKRLGGAEITLLDRTGHATMIPALPDLFSGRVMRSALTRPLAEVVSGTAQVVVDTANRIDLAERTVIGNAGRYRYEGLVIAAGSIPASPPPPLHGLPVHTVATIDAAERFRRALDRRVANRRPGSVVIVGGGYTGLETAAAIRRGTVPERAPRVVVVDTAPVLLSVVDKRRQPRLLDALSARGVEILAGTSVSQAEPTEGDDADDAVTVTLSNGTTIPNALLVWAAGMQAAAPSLHPAGATTRDGRLEVTEELRLPGYPEVLVAGDVAALRTGEQVLRRAVNFAYYSGRTAGKNLAAHLSGGKSTAFHPVDLGWVIPLGDDSAGRIFGSVGVGGRFGLRMHYAMCGVRHFGGGRAGEMYRTAINLNRQPEPLGTPPGGSETSSHTGDEATS